MKLIQHPYFYHFALLRIDQVGPQTFNKCLCFFETPQQVFEAGYAQLISLGLKEKIVEQIISFKKNDSQSAIYAGVQKDVEWLNQPNHAVLSATDAAYPTLLKEIHDYPPLLFVIGNAALLSQ